MIPEVVGGCVSLGGGVSQYYVSTPPIRPPLDMCRSSIPPPPTQTPERPCCLRCVYYSSVSTQYTAIQRRTSPLCHKQRHKQRPAAAATGTNRNKQCTNTGRRTRKQHGCTHTTPYHRTPPRSTAGPTDRGTRGPRTARPVDQRTTGPRTSGPREQWTAGPRDQWTTGPRDQWTTDQWTRDHGLRDQ